MNFLLVPTFLTVIKSFHTKHYWLKESMNLIFDVAYAGLPHTNFKVRQGAN